MTTLSPQEQVTWLIPTIQSNAIEMLELQAELARKEEELKSSPLYREVEEIRQMLKSAEKYDTEMRENGKMMMLTNGLKEFEMLDGTIIALHKTPGSLKIEEWAVFAEKYYRVKKELDKTAIKKDFNDWVPLEGCYIESDYKFVIKSK